MITRITNYLLLALVYFLAFSNAYADSSSNYLLREGDTIHISVWGDETLSKELRVLPDGSVSFPLAGRVEVAGWPITAIENIITGKLKKYLPDPEVTVIVTGTAGNKVYILGKVKNPGPIPITGPLTILQALSIAGGLDKFADSDAIKVIRRDKGKYKVLPVDYDNLLRGAELNSNYILSADDTILVP